MLKGSSAYKDSEGLYRGLTKDEADKRLKEYGYNQIEKRKTISAIQIFFSQFNDFITWILIAATVISGFMGEKADAITILIIVVMNAILGFIQEFKTEKSLEALKQMAAPTAKVIRNGKITVINAEYLVPDDLLILDPMLQSFPQPLQVSYNRLQPLSLHFLSYVRDHKFHEQLHEPQNLLLLLDNYIPLKIQNLLL